MRILFYCQHVLGVGHFFRSMEIARALNRHKILFAGGGESLEGLTPPGNVEMLSLPPLMMDPEVKNILTKDGSLDEISEQRRQILLKSFETFRPDLILTELFPFGRRQFRFELTPLLKLAKEAGSLQAVKIVCSLRDILVEKEKPGYQSEVLETLNRYYDMLLIHADPEMVRLEETFSRFGEISIPAEYTGFVARPSPEKQTNRGRKVIVASSGGGRVGTDLLSATIKAVRKIPRRDLELRIFIGPYMENSDRMELEDLALGDSRIFLRSFSADFLSELRQADLSVSMAGYNTCMDVLSSGTAAIVYPFSQNREQGMRAEKLEKMGFLKIARDLGPDVLRHEIEALLDGDFLPPVSKINLSGASNTALLIEKLAGVQSNRENHH
jgi:predicted glycosyltransferase